ncbi:MAG: hypothetical protein LBT55_01420 [Clostridiaceae bacterium]|jgi:curved DNA-binding protein CbpA|nr:hypothetical protein [Clostridiaceae bacterium]
MAHRDPFQVLGLPQTATQSEIFEAYTRLKTKYGEERFAPGEAGADAARKLNELYDAYNQAMEYCARNVSVEGGGSAYATVEAALKAKDFSKAQQLLDDISTRDAEWHYLQAAVYYNNNWLSESKRQLEIAVEMAPGNKKYRDALNRLVGATDGSRPFNSAQGGQRGEQAERYGYGEQQNVYENQNRRSYSQSNGYGNKNSSANCCNACSACICADCCCECMGGDLIACC